MTSLRMTHTRPEPRSATNDSFPLGGEEVSSRAEQNKPHRGENGGLTSFMRFVFDRVELSVVIFER